MFVSHHTLKWTRTCRSHGRHPHAHTAHFLLNRHTWRDSAESSLPAGTGSESDFHVSPERRAIIFPVSRKEQNNDLRDLLISQQVRRIDELERQVDMLEALLHGRRRKEQAANTLPEEQTDTAADKSPDADGQ